MKLAPLLTRFLYSNKRLDLPGIGTFHLQSSGSYEAEAGKSEKKIDPSAITFQCNTAIKESPELIQFIAAQTGKFKALAAADLDTHIQLIQQFLNIGKPFLLEGIGSLVKVKSGEFAFTSGEAMPETLKDYSAKEISSTSSIEENFSDVRTPINRPSSKTAWRRPAAVMLIVAGIGLAVWGGYTVYKMSVKEKEPADSVVNTSPAQPGNDETPIEQKEPATEDTITNIRSDNKITKAGSFKYILEKAGPKRAFARFAKLKTFQWPVQIETKDSLTYVLYMILHSTEDDTSRIVDSLTTLNGRMVYVEK